MLVGLLKRATDRLEIAVLVYRVGQKVGHKLVTTLLSNPNRLKKIHWKIPWVGFLISI